MKIAEIYVGIEGEGSKIGTPQIFIRTQGCSIKCKWCFGVRPGRKIPKIVFSRTANKKITDVEVGDRLLTLNGKHELVETEVTDVLKREVDEWYEIKIQGFTYFVTPEHPFFTIKGLVEVRDLVVGDEIYHIDFREKISFQKTIDNPMKRPEVVEKSIRGHDYEKQGKERSLRIQKLKEEGKYKSPWSLMSEEQKKKLRKLQSDRMIGDKNPNWNPDLVRYYNFEELKKMCSDRVLNVCKKCESEGKLEVHHIDFDTTNDSLTNLTTICHSCHSKIHKRGYNFWKNKRKDEREIDKEKMMVMKDFLQLNHNGYKVESIKYINRQDKKYIYDYFKPNPLLVHNFSCSPYNTYLVDNMWVHNCDTPEALGKRKGKETTPHDILASLQNNKLNLLNVSITGGNPLEQEDMDELVTLLIKNKYTVSMEVSGQEYHDNIFRNLDFISCDIKPPSSEVEANLSIPRKLLKKFDYKVQFKIVVADKEDLKFMLRVYRDMSKNKHDQLNMIVTPCWPLDQKEVDKKMIKEIQKCIFENDLDIRMILQQHKVIYGPNATGI